jgi:hypothetical protein
MNKRQSRQGWAKTRDLRHYQIGVLWASVLGLALMLIPGSTFGVPTDEPIEAKRVKFTGATYRDVLKDTDGQSYITVNGPDEYKWHWVKEGGNYDHSYPALYVSDSKMEAVVKLTRPPNGRELRFDIKGVTSGGNVSINLSATDNVFAANSATMEVTVVAETKLDAGKVSFFDTIDWTYKETGSSGSGAGAGSSENQVYVTRANPVSGVTLYHTVVHLACRSWGGTSSTQAASKTWEKFTGKNVKAWDESTPLLYNLANGIWTSSASFPSDVSGLLANNTGDCSAWTRLLIDAFRVNGVVGVSEVKVTSSYVSDPNPSNPQQDLIEPMLIKSWTFASGTLPATVLPFTHRWAEVTDIEGVKGQNNGNPPGFYQEHFIVLFIPNPGTLNYYDPSYGNGPYSTQEAWENASTAGFMRYIQLPGQLTPCVKINTTGTIETFFGATPY